MVVLQETCSGSLIDGSQGSDGVDGVVLLLLKGTCSGSSGVRCL